MSFINTLKLWIGALTEVALMLLALGIAVSLIYGANLPFFGNVTANIVTFINELGKNGLVGLIALGLILWLFSKRSMS